MTAFMRVRSVSTAMGRKAAVPVAIGLGTNMGDRANILRRAIAALVEQDPAVLIAPVISDVFESAALLAEGAPEEWNQPFLNLVIAGETLHSPAALLHELKRIEHRLGRVARGHWAPREIDLDIIAYGDHVIQTPVLVVPHAHMLQRAFVLLPLADIWPHWRYPVPGPFAGTPLFALADRHFPVIEETGMKRLGRLEAL